MKNQLNDELVLAIKNSVSDDMNIANLLMDILSMGKEAVYRRLRGDVPFTFDEVSKISSKLCISLDNIVNIKNTKRAFFDLDLKMQQLNDPLDHYCDKLESCILLFQKLHKCKNSTARLALNSLPYMFYLSFPHIAKFRLYRWLYQLEVIPTIGSYEEMVVPQKISDIEKRFVAEQRYIAYTTFIMDQNVFKSFIGDVNYFYKLNLLSNMDVQLIQNELFELISDLETIAATGMQKTGTKVNLYVSNIDLESSYLHFESDHCENSFMRVFSINIIGSQNPTICNIQKEWIESLKRYSTLISVSCEIQRTEYFNTQRELALKMGCF
ncbi:MULTISPECIES: hypothetical protein [unclassified Dysgonomonas]|uniref:hypothetical protein n=1 Tax=unclassified Dysgonomonas TaxID=2630389 RepID=UPI00068157AD|nr:MULTISPECIES: hypothetical protein [unclassified Dysgonomonas]MBD8346669.1 hypothetical protein [Dysgonomonas sp. HGC4]MBF0574401.1 hypothetical protein [Dysgonomonas sp. GY617]